MYASESPRAEEDGVADQLEIIPGNRRRTLFELFQNTIIMPADNPPAAPANKKERPPPPLPPVKVGAYVLGLEPLLLGSGGYGCVYAATKEGDRKPSRYAVKIGLAENLSNDAVEAQRLQELAMPVRGSPGRPNGGLSGMVPSDRGNPLGFGLHPCVTAAVEVHMADARMCVIMKRAQVRCNKVKAFVPMEWWLHESWGEGGGGGGEVGGRREAERGKRSRMNHGTLSTVKLYSFVTAYGQGSLRELVRLSGGTTVGPSRMHRQLRRSPRESVQLSQRSLAYAVTK